jgi:hypothetical protein
MDDQTLTLEEAEALLKEHRGYEWLLRDRQFWSVSEIVRELEVQGFTVSNDAVGRWVKPLPHTQDFGGAVGLRAATADLIILFASRMTAADKKKHA